MSDTGSDEAGEVTGEGVANEASSPRYLIDWLGVVRDPSDRYPVGYLICGPDRGAYTLDVNGSRKTIPAHRIRIQTWKGTAYVAGDSVGQQAVSP